MSNAPSPWTRPHHEPQGGVASVELLIFAEQPLDLSAPLSRSRFGLPAEFPFDEIEISQHLRSEDEEWFEGLVSGALLRGAENDLGDAAERLADMTVVYRVAFEAEEPRDLGYLQACWGAATWICASGGVFVLDVTSIDWHSAESLLALDPLREFEFGDHVVIVFETDETPGFGHVTHTRGLAKFGRPDIVLLGVEGQTEARAAARVLNGLAQRATLGAAFREGQSVRPSASMDIRRLAPYEPENTHPEVHLNNAGLVLDVSGWGLGALGGS